MPLPTLQTNYQPPSILNKYIGMMNIQNSLRNQGLKTEQQNWLRQESQGRLKAQREASRSRKLKDAIGMFNNKVMPVEKINELLKKQGFEDDIQFSHGGEIVTITKEIDGKKITLMGPSKTFNGMPDKDAEWEKVAEALIGKSFLSYKEEKIKPERLYMTADGWQTRKEAIGKKPYEAIGSVSDFEKGFEGFNADLISQGKSPITRSVFRQKHWLKQGESYVEWDMKQKRRQADRKDIIGFKDTFKESLEEWLSKHKDLAKFKAGLGETPEQKQMRAKDLIDYRSSKTDKYKMTPEEKLTWYQRLADYNADLKAPYRETPAEKEARQKRVSQFEFDMHKDFRETPEEKLNRSKELAEYRADLQAPYKETPGAKEARIKRTIAFARSFDETPEQKETRAKRMIDYREGKEAKYTKAQQMDDTRSYYSLKMRSLIDPMGFGVVEGKELEYENLAARLASDLKKIDQGQKPSYLSDETESLPGVNVEEKYRKLWGE